MMTNSTHWEQVANRKPYVRIFRNPHSVARSLLSLVAAGFHDALDVAFRLAFGDIFALIVELLAAREAQFDLGAPALEIEPQRDERETLSLDLAGDALDLAAVQQQLARAGRFMVEISSRLLVRRNMHIVEPYLAADDACVAAAQVEPAAAHRLDFAAGQRQPGLVALLDEVVMARLAVFRYGWVVMPVAACHRAIL